MDYGIRAPEPLPPQTSLGAISLQVSNLDRAVTYYTKTLGLELQDQSADRVTLGAIESAYPLIELRQQSGVRAVPRSGLLGLYHFALLLPTRADLGRFVEHLARQGTPFASADHLVSEAIYLWDPDGLGIEVYADRPRSQWETVGRELAMATDPLDLQDVLASAGQRVWQGLPVGTVMGHMHLSVGDLELARAFYHAALGLDVMVWSYPGALFLATGGYHHHLGTNTWAARARAATDEDARLLSWTLRLASADEVLRAADRLTRAGFETASAGGHADVIDPWGITLRLAP